MDLNINELPEREKRVEPAMPPPPREANMPIKIAGFLAVVVVLTALAINSHQGAPETMASDTPTAVEGASTLPSGSAPAERTTTGSASPMMAPNNPAATSR